MKALEISLFILLQTAPSICHELKTANIRTRSLSTNNSTKGGKKVDKSVKNSYGSTKNGNTVNQGNTGKNGSTGNKRNNIDMMMQVDDVTKNQPVKANKNTSDPVKRSRIVGGITITDPLEYPYIAFPVGSSNCIATLFHDTFLLTSANCKDAFDDGIFLGGTKIDGSESKPMAVEKSIINPDFDPSTNANDVMILKLRESTIGIKKVKLNLYDASIPATNQGLEILGYGALSENGIKSYSDTLQRARIMAAPKDRCLKYRWYSEKAMVCSWFPGGGRDSCSGDAGGPLLLRGTSTQVGIISYGKGCGNQDSPTVNTRISAYADFIKATVCAESSTPLAGISC